MGKASRDKGNRNERALVVWLAQHVWPYAERRGGGFASADIVGTPGWAVEAKNQKTWKVQEWWRQTETQAAEGPAGTIPLLVVKRPGKADPGEHLAVLRLADLAPLLKENDSD